MTDDEKEKERQRVMRCIDLWRNKLYESGEKYGYSHEKTLKINAIIEYFYEIYEDFWH